jgi:Fis family transcriptional regulator
MSSEMESLVEISRRRPQRAKRGRAQLQDAQTLRDCVEIAMNNYFENLDGQSVSEVYEMVLSEVEPPLLEAVLSHTRYNQTKASQVLGLNRGTLRKKLKLYGLL